MPSKGWHARGYLPHFDSQEIVQFVTYRLADSLPLEALERIRLSDQPESLRDELLDRGWGDCWLRLPEIAAIIEQSFLAFDGERYRLYAWTIMPNHVHVLFGVSHEWTLSDIVASWKKFTARRCNRQLGRSGRSGRPTIGTASFAMTRTSNRRSATSTTIPSRPALQERRPTGHGEALAS
jgi:putative transposase